MGLFSDLKKKPSKKSSDDVLLFHAMICMAAADGVLQESEVASVEAFFVALPEFRTHNFHNLLQESNRLLGKHDNVVEAVGELANIESEAVRNKAFVLAVDIALSAGAPGEAEELVIDAMKDVMDIDDELAAKVVEVLALKYAQ